MEQTHYIDNAAVALNRKQFDKQFPEENVFLL